MEEYHGDSELATEESRDEEGDELLRAVRRKYVEALTGKKVRDAGHEADPANLGGRRRRLAGTR